jgi:hypothetical protein
MTIQALTESRFLDFATLAGLCLGLAALIVAYFAPEWRLLAIPGMAALLPSLIYGVR